ncbi:hypothetical protein T4D_5730 [Trichinella pseudospiralis]|uniref:Uncharacterized protein n=1 Tax=Trichinella pseudospiralis TaxID=6337 RepID=A0A0V1FSB1_TRIPS|nr:hypothetical protein T4D_5730 [Trichinella pseudospiralis]
MNGKVKMVNQFPPAARTRISPSCLLYNSGCSDNNAIAYNNNTTLNRPSYCCLATVDSDGNMPRCSRGEKSRLENIGVDRLAVKFGHNAEPVTNKRPPVFENELLYCSFVDRHFGGLQSR